MTLFDELPFEIQEKMLENQMLQGNNRNLDVFRQSISAAKDGGGFDWDKSVEDTKLQKSFWSYVLRHNKHYLFYEEYPKGYSNFVVPKAWCVVVTEKNKKMLEKWRFKGSRRIQLRVGCIVGMINNEKEHNPVAADNTSFGIELTTNQFVHHILNKSVEQKERTFPREMWCWDENKKQGYKDVVHAILPGRLSMYKVIADDSVFRHCEDIEYIHLTAKDISDGKGVGIDPMLIKFKED